MNARPYRLTFLWLALTLSAPAAEPVALNWLDGRPPSIDANVSWGVPWPRGAVARDAAFRLTTANGRAVAVDSWPLAFWPDGSLKWSGHAITAAAGLAGPFSLAPATSGGSDPSAVPTVTCTEDDDGFTIDTGPLRARIARQGDAFFESLTMGDRVVGRAGRLVAIREDRSHYDTDGILRYEEFVSRLRAVTLEQSGPGRAVVRIEGVHRATTGDENPREWLPFTVRLHFHAGSREVRLVHTFVFDGEAERDFIKGLGLVFEVPFVEEVHNRHLRFIGDGSGVWAQPVRMLPGFRTQAGPEIVERYEAHLAGQRVPGFADFGEEGRAALATMPIWGDARLTQAGANGFSIHKRTTAASSWLHVTDGRRALGCAAVGDVSGGLVVGVKDFWQKHPSSLEILHAGDEAAELRVWLWSPDAPAMDLRHYDTKPHGLRINYEDWKPGWATPVGIANTHELTLWACDAVPSNAEITAMAHAAAAPPILVATPAYYHALSVFGHWSLPERSKPALRWVEDQVQGLVDYYRQQVDERSWYGFWNYGDVMHNYDFARHEWRYDIGGWAWVNTELMPDLLLWYSFLRTGRADLYRFAEAMTRHTSEVDVHHLGPFAPLGTRHNVSHWGDGAKQPRISHAGLKRPLYFLSGGDGRLGDLLREQLDADLTYAYLIQFNGAHYEPTTDGGYDLAPRASGPAPRPEDFAPRPTAAERPATRRFGIDWMCYALNWTTEWERGGDPAWRDLVESDIRAMVADLEPNGRLPARYFDMLFGGPENMFMLEPMYDVPEFWAAFANTCEALGRQVGGNQMTAPRLLAYAAHAKNDAELGRLAWEKLIGESLTPPPQPKRVEGPDVVHAVTDPAFLGAPVGWQQHGVASVHWALNALETMELARPWLDAWEAAAAISPSPRE